MDPGPDDAFESLNRYLVQQILGLSGYPQMQGEYTEPLYTEYMPGPSGMVRSTHYVTRSYTSDPLIQHADQYCRKARAERDAAVRMAEEVKREAENMKEIAKWEVGEGKRQVAAKLNEAAARKELRKLPPEWGMLGEKRIGDPEREVVLGHLSLALQGGYLDLEQYQVRSDAALKAKTRAELDRPLGDLPTVSTMQFRMDAEKPEAQASAAKTPAFSLGPAIVAQVFGLIALTGGTVSLGLTASVLVAPVAVAAMMVFMSLITTLSIAKRAGR